MADTIPTIETRKDRLRQTMLAARKAVSDPALDAGIAQHAIALLTELLGDWPQDAPPPVIAGYWPIKGEADPGSIMTALNATGQRVALPVVLSLDVPLVFRQWTPDMVLETGRLNILVPPETAPQLEPDILLVPLVAFDPRGYRLGMGGGFYDRTIAALKASKSIVTIGLAYTAQAVDELPVDQFDQCLDWIITEQEAMSIPTRYAVPSV